jgi:hypothetical protein
MRIPAAQEENQGAILVEGRGPLGTGAQELLPQSRLPKRDAVQRRVTHDGVIDPMRRLQDGDPPMPLHLGGEEREGKRLRLDGGEQGLFQPIGLALHRIEQHTEDQHAIDEPLFRGVHRAVAVVFVGRWEDFVPRSTGRLETDGAAQSAARPGDCLMKAREKLFRSRRHNHAPWSVCR